MPERAETEVAEAKGRIQSEWAPLPAGSAIQPPVALGSSRIPYAAQGCTGGGVV